MHTERVSLHHIALSLSIRSARIADKFLAVRLIVSKLNGLKKIHVVSSSVKKKRFPVTPHKSYSQLSRVCRLKFEESDSDEDEIAAIKKVISTKDQLTLSEIESYERKTRKYIKSLERRKEHERRDLLIYVYFKRMKRIEEEYKKVAGSNKS